MESVEALMQISEFYQDKKVFVTGHTGFKGSWLCKVLSMAGAKVMGYALAPDDNPNLYSIAEIGQIVDSATGDIRDLKKLADCLQAFQPEIVLHLAAQPLVRESYDNPVYTYETNVIGTVNVLEAIRHCPSVKSFVNVTTDKVYKNCEWEWGYRETDILDGHDPYSNSKSCSELVTNSYRKSFFTDNRTAISTARAGNVIGGGDFAKDRIIPDCVRSAIKNEKIILRNPYSTRPYQHVLEPNYAYLLLAQKQFENISLSGSYNICPNNNDCVTNAKLADCFCNSWGESASWDNFPTGGPHEANFLKLDCSKAKAMLGWRPVWNIDQAVQKTVDWFKCYYRHEDVSKCMEEQIKAYLKENDSV